MSHLDRLLAKQIRDLNHSPDGPTDSDQRQARPVPTTELPPFEVVCDYGNARVAVLFEPEDIPALADHPLFLHAAAELHAAAAAAEQQVEGLIQAARDRAITGGIR